VDNSNGNTQVKVAVQEEKLKTMEDKMDGVVREIRQLRWMVLGIYAILIGAGIINYEAVSMVVGFILNNFV